MYKQKSKRRLDSNTMISKYTICQIFFLLLWSIFVEVMNGIQ